MPRPQKRTVEYFPHDCMHGKTMFIIEGRYGNDGYTFWFKLLETLGTTDGHCLDLNDEAEKEFFVTKTRLSEGFCTEILNLLAKLDAIDPELWAENRVWCQKFVDSLAIVYNKRNSEIPRKPGLSQGFRTENPPSDPILEPKTPSKEGFRTGKIPPPHPPLRVEKSRVEYINPPIPAPQEPKPEKSKPIQQPPPSAVLNKSQSKSFAFTIMRGEEKAEVSWKYWQRIINRCNGDKHAAARVFFRSFKKANPGQIVQWIEAGIKPENPYAFIPIVDESENPKVVEGWIDSVVFKIKNRGPQQFGSILNEAMKAASNQDHDLFGRPP